MKISLIICILSVSALLCYAIKNKKTELKKAFNIPGVQFTGNAPCHTSSINSMFTESNSEAFTMTSTAIFPTDRSRAIYNQIKRENPGSVTTPGYLRMEKSLQGSFNSIRFDVLVNENNGGINVTERRLALTDKFVMTSLGVYLIKAGAGTTATDAEKAAAKLRANNNALIFTAAGEAAFLEGIYNGYLKIVIDGKVYLEALDIRRFYRIETAQKGVGPAVITTDDGWPSPNYGMAELTPSIELNGMGKNEITAIFPTSMTGSGTASQNFICLYAKGLLVQNASRLNAQNS